MLTLRTYEMEEVVCNELLLSTARRLSLGDDSGMNRALDRYIESAANALRIHAKGIFAYRGEIAVGWCLLTKEHDGLDFYPQDGQACIHVFVDEAYRRQGVGSALLREAATVGVGYVLKCYYWGEPDFFEPFVKQNICQNLES